MTGDGMYFTNLANTLRHISSDEKAVFLSGCPGSGKTFAALQFCSEHKENLYFSIMQASGMTKKIFMRLWMRF